MRWSRAGCTTPTCSPARAASARPRCRASWPRASTAPAPDGQGRITAHPCGVCTACSEIDGDRFIDYIELDAASNRSIDEIRDLIERAAYKPSVGRYKVFMIDEAHQLTKDAFNALLKTLEEPPEYLKFVLATTDPEKMLPTVLSRCLQFNLRPMAPETVAAHLQQVLGAEGLAFDAGSLRLLSRGARGSMRDALSLTDQAIAYGAGALEESACGRCWARSTAATPTASWSRSRGGTPAPCWPRSTRCAAWACRPRARWRRWRACCSSWRSSRPCPAPWTPAIPTPRPRARWPARCRPTSAALYSIAVHGRAELSLAPDDMPAW